nr:hypothetical protein [Tanacetum cinerariifolium]
MASEMDKRTDLNKLDGIEENFLKRIRRSRELRATTLSDEGINPGMFDYNGNLKPSKSILKKGISPTKEGRKVSMNTSTMVWEVAKEIGKVSNDGESGVSTNLNPSPNINANATEFEKDVPTTVNTASDKVLNSFASVLKHKVNRVAEIIELRIDECVEGAAMTIPLAAIEEVTSRFENTLYGYFVSKRLAYQESMNRVLDYGAWLSRRVPLLLNIWSPNFNLHKTEIKKGHSAYARALIEISAENVLKEDLVIAIPVGKAKGHSLASIRIEYEWRPPRCSTCLIFDHTDDKCPKLSKELTPAVVTNIELNHSKDVADDGFEIVKKKQNKKKKHQKQVDGVVLNKPSLNLHYRRVDKGDSSKNVAPMVDKGDSSKNVAPMSTGNVASTSSVPTTTSTIGSGTSAAK